MKKLLLITLGASCGIAQAETLAPYQYNKLIYYQDRAAAKWKPPQEISKKIPQEKKSNEN